jgi:ATP-dependent DNA ligase
LFIPGGTSSDVVRIDLADKLKLVLFDVIEVLGVTAMDKPLIQRRALLELCVKHCPKGGRVLISEQQPVSLAAVQAIWAAKGEGAILKKLDATYRSGYRTPAWVKVKLVSAAELTITGFEAGKNGPFSVAKLKHDDGRETSVKVLTQELLRAVEKDSAAFVGKRLVVSHMGKTSSGALRHAVWDHLLETA